MPHSSKKRGHFRKKPDVVQIPTWVTKERDMEKTLKEPMGPPTPPKPGDKPAPDEEPTPGRPPHWHEGDPEEPEEK